MTIVYQHHLHKAVGGNPRVLNDGYVLTDDWTVTGSQIAQGFSSVVIEPTSSTNILVSKMTDYQTSGSAIFNLRLGRNDAVTYGNVNSTLGVTYSNVFTSAVFRFNGGVVTTRTYSSGGNYTEKSTGLSLGQIAGENTQFKIVWRETAGNITQVEFYIGGTLVSTHTSAGELPVNSIGRFYLDAKYSSIIIQYIKVADDPDEDFGDDSIEEWDGSWIVGLNGEDRGAYTDDIYDSDDDRFVASGNVTMAGDWTFDAANGESSYVSADASMTHIFLLRRDIFLRFKVNSASPSGDGDICTLAQLKSGDGTRMAALVLRQDTYTNAASKSETGLCISLVDYDGSGVESGRVDYPYNSTPPFFVVEDESYWVRLAITNDGASSILSLFAGEDDGPCSAYRYDTDLEEKVDCCYGLVTEGSAQDYGWAAGFGNAEVGVLFATCDVNVTMDRIEISSPTSKIVPPLPEYTDDKDVFAAKFSRNGLSWYNASASHVPLEYTDSSLTQHALGSRGGVAYGELRLNITDPDYLAGELHALYGSWNKTPGSASMSHWTVRGYVNPDNWYPGLFDDAIGDFASGGSRQVAQFTTYRRILELGAILGTGQWTHIMITAGSLNASDYGFPESHNGKVLLYVETAENSDIYNCDHAFYPPAGENYIILERNRYQCVEVMFHTDNRLRIYVGDDLMYTSDVISAPFLIDPVGGAEFGTANGQQKTGVVAGMTGILKQANFVIRLLEEGDDRIGRDLVFEELVNGALPTPTFNPAAGAVESGTEVTPQCSESGVTFHYTTDGSDPTEASPVLSGAYTVTGAVTLKVIAVKDGWQDSATASAAYTINLPSGGGGINSHDILEMLK